jgi:hypothetical protein
MLQAFRRGLPVVGAIAFTSLFAAAAQAGGRAPQTRDVSRKFSPATSGRAVAVWVTKRGLRVAVARPGRAFARSRAIAGSDPDSDDLRSDRCRA